MKEVFTKEKEVALLGSVETSTTLHEYYLHHVRELVLKGAYHTYTDFVFTGEFINQHKLEEEEEFESLPKNYLDKVIYFDDGIESDMDLALTLSKYILEGVHCVVYSEQERRNTHDLITIVQVKVPEIV